METRLINPHDCQCVQSRVSLNMDTVDEYDGMMTRGIVFEPCKGILCADGQIIIYDGNHRVEAAKATGTWLEVDLMPGTETDAEWWAAGANSRHGIRRSVSDIEKAVKTALRHAFADGKSDREIARHCGVDHKTVGKYRKELELSGERPQIDTRTVMRNGTEYQMTIPVPTAPDPEPTPPRVPSPMVYDAHMPTTTRIQDAISAATEIVRAMNKQPQAESTDVEIQNLIKDTEPSMIVCCFDCGEIIPHFVDRSEIPFCVECEQARAQERQRLTEVHQQHGLIPPEPEFPQHAELQDPESGRDKDRAECDFCQRDLPAAELYFSKYDCEAICQSCASRALHALLDPLNPETISHSREMQ